MTVKGKRLKKAVIYKRTEFHTVVPGESLKTLLDKALAKRATNGERKLNVADGDQPVYHLIGRSQCEVDGFTFGQFMTYTPGTDPLILVDDEKAGDVTLEKLSIPATEDGKRREFLESMMFFGAFENHLVLMQSQALKAPQLETYLRWLLHESGVLAKSNSFALVDTPSKQVRDRLDAAKGVRSIKLGGELLPASVMPPEPTSPETAAALVPAPGGGTQKVVHAAQSVSLDSAATATEEGKGMLEALKSFLSPSQLAKIDFDKLAGSNIEMSVTLRYKRTTNEDGRKLMDTLGAALRNTSEVETELTLADGGVIRGTDLKLNGAITVTSYDGQFGPTEVFEEMRQWLLGKVASQDVQAS